MHWNQWNFKNSGTAIASNEILAKAIWLQYCVYKAHQPLGPLTSWGDNRIYVPSNEYRIDYRFFTNDFGKWVTWSLYFRLSSAPKEMNSWWLIIADKWLSICLLSNDEQTDEFCLLVCWASIPFCIISELLFGICHQNLAHCVYWVPPALLSCQYHNQLTRYMRGTCGVRETTTLP